MSDLKTKTKESKTVDGSVEYTAVECAYCGYDTPTEEATMVVFPTYVKYKNKRHGGNGIKIEHADDAPTQAFCKDCTESLFGDVRENNYQKSLTEWVKKREYRFWAILAIHIGGVVFATIGLAALITALL